MAGGTVGWHFLDVESGLVPDESSPSILPGEGKGRIVVLAATPFAMKDGWAARAATTIAGDWAREGLQIFLMDLGLEGPSLHDALDLPNEEGIADAFLFGASIQHIARPAMDGRFFFAPAGSRPGDPGEVLAHPRWNDLAGGFSEAEATLLLFLPVDTPGSDRILSRATDIVFFSAQGESAERHLGPASIKVVANIGPVGSPPEEIPQEDRPERPEEEAGVFPGPGEEEIGALEEVGLPEGEEHDVQDVREEPAAEEPETQEAPLREGETPSPFDFSGEFELAEGFGDDWGGEDAQETIPDAQETIPQGEGEADHEAEEVDTHAPVHWEPEPEGEVEPELEADSLQGFGSDLTMGSSLADHPEERTTKGAPDFGAEFVELADEDHETGAPGEFGSDLVQGADFGDPTPDVPPPAERPLEDTQPPEDLPPSAPPGKPAPEPPREPRKRRPAPRKPFPFGKVAAVVLVVGILGAAVAAGLGYIDIPGLSSLQSRFGDIPDPPLTLAGPQPNEEILQYSLVLFRYEEAELQDASEMLNALRARQPDLLFFLAPEEEDGELFYTLMAGPAYDRIEAEELRGPISQVLTREDPEAWAVRETPRGFYLGERETLADAEEYMRSLSMEGVHPYILHVTYPDGAEAFEVMAGAYQGVLDARPLQLILRDHGLRDLPLIERRGRLPE